MPDNAAVQQGGTAVARRETSDVGQFKRQLEARARDIQMALPAHISQDKFQRTVLTAVAQNPDLLKADRDSLVLACYKAAQDGLLPDGREAALVTFNTRFKDATDGQWKSKKVVQYMPMVYGLRKKVLQSGEIVDLFASVVFKQEIEAGRFIYEEGTERMLRHKPTLDPDFSPTDDDIALAYSVATFKDGSKSFEVMFRRDINKVRQCSQTGAVGKTDRQGKAIDPKGPWVEWFAEQAKKSAIRRHTKTLPMSSDVFVDVEGREQLEYGSSTALALGSQTPDDPLAIENRADEVPHDPETGEVIEPTSDSQIATDEATETEQPKEAEQKPARGRSRQQTAEPEKAEEPAAQEEVSADAPSVAEQLEDHPAAAKADEIIGQFSKAETVIDLEQRYKENESDIAAMPDDIYETVMGGYNRHRVRLGAQRVSTAMPETVK